MKPHLLSLLFILGCFSASSQIIFDFETPSTSTNFQYFGSSLDGTPNEIIDNPNATGVNTSLKVGAFTKPADAMTWAGAFAVDAPTIDVTAGGQICIDVHMDHIGNLALKLEASPTASNWITTQVNTTTDQWETICFDLTANGLEDDETPAAGNVYNQIVLFFDFDAAGTGTDVTNYFDNINYVPPSVEVLLFDFETPETSTLFQYFGSSLDGTQNVIIDNPDPNGINTSPKVASFTKITDAMTWAGAFAVDAPVVDATSGGKICIDVHMDHIGNIAVKLEASPTASNWITTQPNTKINEWETLCFDLSANGLEDAETPATGHVFNQIVVFHDFGSVVDMEEIYYIDNFKLVTSAVAEESEVTFSVDMNGSGQSFTQVYLIGEFNDWTGDANPMDDADGDNVWTTTLMLKNGSYEYKYILDDGTVSEQFDGNDVCTVSTIGSNGEVFTNRLIRVTEDVTSAVCFESCYECGESINITWNVNMSNEVVSPEGVFLAGGPYFGHGKHPLTDVDGDGIHTITIEREKGFASDYVFINGICLPDWGCKEQLAGQDCAVMPFNDRNIVTGDDDVVLNTCFGECTTDGSCSGGPLNYMATFNVDMKNEVVAGGVFLSGQLINGWSPDATPMLDADGDGIYSVSVELPAAIVEFKFVNGSAYEEFTAEGACNITDPSGQFINRLLLMEEKDTVLAPYLFESCDISTDTRDLTFDDKLFSLNPTISSNTVNIRWTDSGSKVLRVVSVSGQVVKQINIDAAANEFTLDVTQFGKGLYLVNLMTETKVGLRKMIVE